MNTIDTLKALTTTSPSLRGKENLTLRIDPGIGAPSIVNGLKEYLEKRKKVEVIKLIFDEDEVGYLDRTDFLASALVVITGIGASDGATTPGYSEIVKLIDLCCPVKRCSKRLLVTSYDRDNPPFCDDHQRLMKPCDDT